MQNSRSLKEAFDSLRQVKLCIGQRKYKQTFTTQGRIDLPSEWIRARSVNSYFAFCKIVVKIDTTQDKRRFNNSNSPNSWLCFHNLLPAWLLHFLGSSRSGEKLCYPVELPIETPKTLLNCPLPDETYDLHYSWNLRHFCYPGGWRKVTGRQQPSLRYIWQLV